MKSTSPDRPAVGIRRTDKGWRVFVRVKNTRGESELRSKRFPWNTKLPVMKLWREEQRARATLRMPEAPARVADGSSTLSADIDTYLATVPSMPTLEERRAQLARWCEALGPSTPRASITSADIRKVLETWKVQGYTVRRRVVTTAADGTETVSYRREARKYSDTTLKHRRTALMSLWTVLDGKSAPNPVRDVPKPRPDVLPLDLPTIEDAERAIAAIERHDRTGKKARPDTLDRRDGLKTRARLRVMLWTGWPPAQIAKLDPKSLMREVKAGEVTVPRRSKGKGTKTVRIPILPQAAAALEQFDQAQAYGEFSTSSVGKSLSRACDAVGVRRFRPYDLRHLFLTTIALITGDAIAVNFLGMHTTMNQTDRYIEQAKVQRARQAITTTAAQLPRVSAPAMEHIAGVTPFPVKVTPRPPSRARRA